MFALEKVVKTPCSCISHNVVQGKQ